jgi:hypothetical protein
MKVKFLITIALSLAFILTGCFFGSGGPSDAEVKEFVAKSVEGGMDAFCPSPEVLSIELIERGNVMEHKNEPAYPIRVEVAKKCGINMFSRGETKTEKKSYVFWLNEYDEWRFRSSSRF